MTNHHRSFWDFGWLATVVFLGLACVLSVIVIDQLATVVDTLSGEQATAAVTAYREQRSRSGSATYRPVFRFTTKSGETIEATSHTGWGWKGTDIGGSVMVAYPASRPLEAEIVDSGLFINAFFFALFALPLLALGLVSLRAGLRRTRAARGGPS